MVNMNIDNIYTESTLIDDLQKLEYDIYKKNNQNSDVSLDDYKKTSNVMIKILSSKDNKEKLKDPNILVKVIRWFRGLYRNVMLKYNHPMTSKDKNFIQRFLGRILKFIDRLMQKLERLVDRRTYDQISNEEKLNKNMEYIANNDFKYTSDLDDVVGAGKYKYSGFEPDAIHSMFGVEFTK